jgi:hypothetical protein
MLSKVFDPPVTSGETAMIDGGGIEKLLLHREGVLALLALHIQSGSSERIWPGARDVGCFTSFSHPNTWLCLNKKSHMQVKDHCYLR